MPVRPFETVTLRVRPAARARPRGRRGRAGGTAAATSSPEPAQPVYTRYWLHGKGPAPAGNVPVAVHFSPTRVTLGGADGGRPGRALALTVAAGPGGRPRRGRARRAGWPVAAAARRPTVPRRGSAGARDGALPL